MMMPEWTWLLVGIILGICVGVWFMAVIFDRMFRRLDDLIQQLEAKPPTTPGNMIEHGVMPTPRSKRTMWD